MKTLAIVPAKTFENAKTRLSLMLDIDERIRLSSLLLDYTLDVLANVSSLTQVVVVSADKRAKEIGKAWRKFCARRKGQWCQLSCSES